MFGINDVINYLRFLRHKEELDRLIRPQLAGDSMKTPVNVNITNRVQSPSNIENVDDVKEGVIEDEDDETIAQEDITRKPVMPKNEIVRRRAEDPAKKRLNII